MVKAPSPNLIDTKTAVAEWRADPEFARTYDQKSPELYQKPCAFLVAKSPSPIAESLLKDFTIEISNANRVFAAYGDDPETVCFTFVQDRAGFQARYKFYKKLIFELRALTSWHDKLSVEDQDTRSIWSRIFHRIRFRADLPTLHTKDLTPLAFYNAWTIVVSNIEVSKAGANVWMVRNSEFRKLLEDAPGAHKE